MLCCQQQYRAGGKSAGQEKNSLYFGQQQNQGEFARARLQTFLHMFSTSMWLIFFSITSSQVVCTTGDISAFRMNVKSPKSIPCCQQQYQTGDKSAGSEILNSFYDHYLTTKLLFFNYIITGGPCNWGVSAPRMNFKPPS
jgi:hypothetical protein